MLLRSLMNQTRQGFIASQSSFGSSSFTSLRSRLEIALNGTPHIESRPTVVCPESQKNRLAQGRHYGVVVQELLRDHRDLNALALAQGSGLVELRLDRLSKRETMPAAGLDRVRSRQIGCRQWFGAVRSTKHMAYTPPARRSHADINVTNNYYTESRVG